MSIEMPEAFWIAVEWSLSQSESRDWKTEMLSLLAGNVGDDAGLQGGRP